jgi:hypothetical protein
MHEALLEQEDALLAASNLDAWVVPIAPQRSAAEDLQVVRRLDWRLLLSEPRLRRVAYVGSGLGALVDALKRFSESLTIFATADESFAASQSNRAFDLVVMPMPAIRDLEMMRHLVKRGGHLYVEMRRELPWKTWRSAVKRKPRGPSLEDYTSVLRRVGFQEVETYWHRPNFESCLEIIPLDDRAALGHVFSRRRTGLASLFKLISGRLALEAGLLSRYVPCVSIVARKPLAAEESP